MPSDKKQGLIVTISGDRPIKEVVRDLKAAGMEVGDVLEAIGSVTGRGDPKHKAKMRNIPGVADVSDDHEVDIGPPGDVS